MDVIAIAKEYGFELTEADFQPESHKLSDDELAAVSAAGGCGCIRATSICFAKALTPLPHIIAQALKPIPSAIRSCGKSMGRI